VGNHKKHIDNAKLVTKISGTRIEQGFQWCKPL